MLHSNAINCVRGNAARAIGHLLWEDRELFSRFKNIIDLEKLLNLTLPQIWGIKNLGEIGINELVLLIQKYINDHTPKTKNSVQKPTNEEIQNLLNAIHSQGRSVREVTELLEKNII